MTLDTRPTALYRTSGERAVRAGSFDDAAWLLADRMARRQLGRSGEVRFVKRAGSTEGGSAVYYVARLIDASGCATSVQFVVRRA